MNNGDRPINPIENHDLAVDIATVGYSDFSGMTKREMIAMHAMGAMLSSKYVSEFAKDGNDDPVVDEMYSGLAIEAVTYADALLKELDKPVREG